MLQRSNSKLLFTIILVAMAAFAWSQNGPGGGPSPADDIIHFLNQSILWHRELTTQQQLATEPSDVLFLRDNRQLADQIVRLSFEYARARAQTLGSSGASTSQTSNPSQYQRLADYMAKTENQVKQSQQQLDDLKKQLSTAAGRKRRTLQARIDETQSELELFQARRDAARSMLQVTASGTSGASVAGLSAQIEELARTVPGVEPPKEATGPSGQSSNAATSPAMPTPSEHKVAPSGMIAVISEIFGLQRKISALDGDLKATTALSETSKALRTPLIAKARELTQKGDELANQPDSTDPSALAQQRKDVDALTAQYKQLSTSLVPLAKQAILLNLYQRSLESWRGSVESQYESLLKGFALRLAGLAIVIGIVLGMSELWRRATFRYVTDARRRSQFMLLRRIVTWGLMAIIISVALASEIGAITTFAGLLTIGITVALQNVILSVAGYFFLIGKYGVRVGDRVQVAGVTGDVVDVGLVRLHLMEVTSGTLPRPTGRVVVFSNAVVFQAGAGLFKQLPGTSFQWHEITLTLSPQSNYRDVEKRLLDAVNRVVAEYKDDLERQRRTVERSLHMVQIGTLTPESRLRLTPDGLEVVIRYPVELASAAQTDDRVTRELLEAIGHDPKLRLLGAKIEAQTA